jgi:HEAT repeat protein
MNCSTPLDANTAPRAKEMHMKNRFNPLYSPLLGIACAVLAGVTHASDDLPAPPAPPVPPSSPAFSILAQAPAAPVSPAAPKSQPAPRPAPAARPAPPAPAAPLPPDDDKSQRRPPTEEESLALAAIEGLMSMPPERALPLLKKVMAGQQTVLVKRRALFVLGQFDSDEAVAILLDTARNGAPSLKYDAIRNIGIHGNQKGLKALQDIYTAGDSRVKREVLSAWLIAGRKEEVYQVAATSKDEKDVAQAIRTLSAMGAREELRKLAEVQKSHRGLVQAYAVSGDLESLVRIANSNGDLATRVDAVRSIGIIGNDPARKALREIYLSSGDKSLRDAALQGMHVSGDQQGVLALYRAAKTSEEKRALLRTLSVMGGDAALDAIDAALEGKK